MLDSLLCEIVTTMPRLARVADPEDRAQMAQPDASAAPYGAMTAIASAM